MGTAAQRPARAPAGPGSGVVAQLAADVHDRLPDDGTRHAIPVALIVALLQALTIVMQSCQPTPAGAAGWLRDPGPSLFGWRRRAWQGRIRSAVADAWTGDGGSVEGVQEAVLARIRAGFGPAAVGRLYAEAGANP